MSSQGFNGGVFVRQGGRELAFQPILKVPREAHCVHRSQAVIGEWLMDIYVLRLDLDNLREPANSPDLNRFRSRGLLVRSGVFGLLSHNSLLYYIQTSGEKVGPAYMTLNLAAGGLGNGARLEQRHRINAQFVIFSHCSPDGLYYLFSIQRLDTPRQVTALYLGHDYQALLARNADRNRGTASRT